MKRNVTILMIIASMFMAISSQAQNRDNLKTDNPTARAYMQKNQLESGGRERFRKGHEFDNRKRWRHYHRKEFRHRHHRHHHGWDRRHQNSWK